MHFFPWRPTEYKPLWRMLPLNIHSSVSELRMKLRTRVEKRETSASQRKVQLKMEESVCVWESGREGRPHKAPSVFHRSRVSFCCMLTRMTSGAAEKRTRASESLPLAEVFEQKINSTSTGWNCRKWKERFTQRGYTITFWFTASSTQRGRSQSASDLNTLHVNMHRWRSTMQKAAHNNIP